MSFVTCMSIFKMTFENILYIKKERAFNGFFVVRQEFLFLMIPKILSPQSRKESVLFLKKNLFIYVFLVTLGLHCCTWAFSTCSERRLLSS